MPASSSGRRSRAILRSSGLITQGGIDFGSDFVCASKHALSYGVSGSDVELAVAVPGPEVDRLAATAQRAGCYAIMGFLERNGVKPLNSAVVLDGA